MKTRQAEGQLASSGENEVIRENMPSTTADDEVSLTQSHLFNEPSRIPNQSFKTGINHLQSNL
ncbi:hypothetical protein F2Q70_00005971 [Brassica cretica]|uniref:Uncharacterized protein n=1 Tax=Brassica cretica TaxID=69181 RepID=A0A8S9IMJ0_BRACR|nr:hypothetical protein F2Q68_00022574 [Brassica cretica]KAF2571089.1 hypothetical protein F2Q70_00005971 [Brassica cretica]